MPHQINTNAATQHYKQYRMASEKQLRCQPPLANLQELHANHSDLLNRLLCNPSLRQLLQSIDREKEYLLLFSTCFMRTPDACRLGSVHTLEILNRSLLVQTPLERFLPGVCVLALYNSEQHTHYKHKHTAHASENINNSRVVQTILNADHVLSQIFL